MGDVVLGDLIRETPVGPGAARGMAWSAPAPSTPMWWWPTSHSARRRWGSCKRLREAGLRADLALAPAKVAKQFQAAEAAQARVAVIVGAEFPAVKIKDLAARTEQLAESSTWLAAVVGILQMADKR